MGKQFLDFNGLERFHELLESERQNDNTVISEALNNLDGRLQSQETATTNNVTYTGTLSDEKVAVFEGTDGTIKSSGYTIAKSVPSNAVFTDTHVTAAANHYEPTADSNSELTASVSGTVGAYAKDTEYTVLTGVKAQRDAKGHITGLTYTAQKIKDTNTTYTSLKNPTAIKINSGGTDVLSYDGSAAKTLTVTGGTNKFTISDGTTSKDVTITPSINKNVTGSAAWTAADKIVVTNAASGNVIKQTSVAVGDLATKESPELTGTPTAPTAAVGTNTTQIATTAFVQTAVNNGIATNDAMIYKGTIDGGSTGNYGALTTAASKGWTYKVSTAGKINGVAVEIGDMLICNADDTAAATSSDYTTIAAKWDVIQGNIDGAVIGPTSAVADRIAIFNGTTGKIIKDSGYTIATSVPANAKFTDTDTKVTSAANHYTPTTVSGSDLTKSASGATASWGIDVVKGVTLNTDGKGHVTGLSVTSGKLPSNPNTDTKVTQNAAITTNGNYPIILAYSTATTEVTNAVNKAALFTYNPNTQTINVPTVNATTLIATTLKVGDNTYNIENELTSSIPITSIESLFNTNS